MFNPRRIGQQLGIALMMILIVLVSGADEIAAQGPIQVVTSTQVQLRVGPGRQYSSLGVVPGGTELSADARNPKTDWVRVNHGGQTGWLSVAYLRYRGDLNTLPVAEANAPTSGSGGQPTPPPASGSGGQPISGDGAILSMDLYYQSDRVDYYRIFYSSGGLRVAGFYAEPRTYGRFAAVIYNRGGNRGTGALVGYEFVPFAEAGFVVVASQYRGCCGSEGYDNFGGVELNDVLALIPLLKSRDKVDPNRIAMFGSSRGAMMTYLAIKTQVERGGNDIKVASTTSGLADLIAWARENKDLNKGFYQSIIGSTTANPGPFVARSAVYWPNMLRVPLLIQHGTGDPIVSYKQSQALYDGLVKAGMPAKLILHVGGDHGLNNYETGMPETFQWFAQYIGGGENWNYYDYKDVIYNVMVAIKGR